MKTLIIIVLIIFFVSLVIIAQNLRFRNSWLKDVNAGFVRTGNIKAELLTEKDLEHLPLPVQKYLRYTGAVNREKVKNVHILFEGTLQEQNKPAFGIEADQYSFFDTPERLFYIKGKMMGVPVNALHKYKNASATFEVKPLSLFHIVNEKGETLDKAETVTFLNDMCLLAPSTLIDKRISWEAIDSCNARAIITVNGITVSAILVFDNEGALVSFWSDDRYYRKENKEMVKIRWTTPVKEYRDYNGFRLASYGEAVWSFPEGDFSYAKFYLKGVEYNRDSR
jgi:hypothetical protein